MQFQQRGGMFVVRLTFGDRLPPGAVPAHIDEAAVKWPTPCNERLLTDFRHELQIFRTGPGVYE
jgi:hypothetical protein